MPAAAPKADPPSDRPTDPTAVVRADILAALGRPPGLLRVSVQPLWDGCYRVNVVVGPDPASARVADSFFVSADAAGRVTRAVPPVSRRY